MDIVNITLWSETVAFPLLTTLALVPLVTMFIVLWLPSPALALRTGIAGTILTILLSAYLLYVFDPAQPGIQLYEQLQTFIFSYTVGVDGASILFIPLTAILMLLALIYTLTTRRSSDRIQVACILGYGAILIAAFSAMNALQFWFMCVLELIPVVIMTIRAGSGQNRRWVVALLLQHWGSGLMMVLVGFMMYGFSVMGAGETLNFDWVVLRQSDVALEYGTLIFFLLFFGFAIRMSLFPFHGWLPVLAEQGTIASVGIFLLGLKLGVYAVIRFVIPFVPEVAEQWAGFVLVLGLIGIFYGALLALMQINIRRLLAFAVVSQTGMLIIGVFDFNTHGLEGSILLSLAFGLATAGILFCIGMIYKRTHTAFIPRLGNMFDAHTSIAVLFVICALSTMVMPGTPGFDGIHLLVEGTIKGYGWTVSIAILFGSVLTAALLLRAFQQIFIAEAKRHRGTSRYSNKVSIPPSPRNEKVIAAVICTIIIGVGVHTSPWLNMIDQGVASMSELHSTSYEVQHSDTATVLTNSKDTQDE